MNETLIRPLSPALVEDYLTFFDRDAFVDNPAWASCYCYFYLAPDKEKAWEARTGTENRAAMHRLICASRVHGYLAYVAEKPVAWYHAAPRVAIPNLQYDEQLRVDDLDQVGSIVCFVVAQPYRGQGIARQLLDAAVDGFRRQGLTWAEAYPRKGATSAAANYHGPAQMYLDAGFEPFREFEDYMIVRKSLWAW